MLKKTLALGLMIGMACAEQVPFNQWAGSRIVDIIAITQSYPAASDISELARLVPELKGGVLKIGTVLGDAWRTGYNSACDRIPDNLRNLRDQIVRDIAKEMSQHNQI